MKKINILLLLISLSYISYSPASTQNEWNDITQDSIQIKKPIEYIDQYDKYILINKKFKIKLKEFGDVKKSKNNISYIQKK